MDPLQEEIDRVTITLTSPDKTIRLKTGINGKAEITFAPGTFERHTKDSVAHQLATLLRTGVKARQLAFQQVIDRAFADPESAQKYALR